ncbi:MAG: MOSC domain-containing protein [Planctomycetota bacterium]
MSLPTVHNVEKMSMAVILSIQIGKIVTEGDPSIRDLTGREWTSAFRKTPVTESVNVTRLGIEGDQVADTENHGGPDKAILCYAASHYALWEQEHPQLDFGPGGFGENLTIDGIDEADVCVGDRWQTTHCEFEVSQPRQPCWKISRRWQTKSLTKEVSQSGRTGWYLRIIHGGALACGEEVRLKSRPNSEWTVRRANDVLFGREKDRSATDALRELEQLSADWKSSLR